MPVGSIIAWIMRIDGNGGNVTQIPPGWIRCDGVIITEGLWEGKLAPDLNGDRRFLRGGGDADVLTFEDDQMPSHTHSASSSSSSTSTSSVHATVNDPGHYHYYYDKYQIDGSSISDNSHDQAWPTDHRRSTESSRTGISVDVNVDVSTSTRTTTTISNSGSGDETRVKNMGVVWIMRIW